MRHKTFWILLGAEAVLCVLLCVMRASFTGVFSAAMAFPFEQLGLCLRALSLSGGPGNAAAIVIYAAVSLIPVAAILVLRKRRELHREDWLLGLLSGVLFSVLYLMVNPGSIGSLFGGAAGLTVSKAILGGTVYSVVCGYIVLRTLRLFFANGIDKLQKYMAVLLSLLALLFVYMAFGVCFGKLLDSITALRAGNAGNEHLLGASHIFLALQFAADALPNVLNVFVVFAALRLLRELGADRYSRESVAAAERLSRLCGAALAATVLSNIAFNLLQLIFAKSLMIINSTVQIPVFSIAFVLAILLLARFVAENKRLKDDNDMFI